MKVHTDNILTSFFLALIGGTVIRAIFLYINQPILDISIYKTFLIGGMIDSLVLSILFLPALLFLILRIRLLKYIKFVLIFQRFYLFTIISLFLISSFIDIFIFKIYHYRLNPSLIEKTLDIPLSILLNMLQSQFDYEVLLLPLLLIIGYGSTCWFISIKKFYQFSSKKIFCKSKPYKEISLQKQLQMLLISHLLIFIFTSFIYIPFLSSMSFDQIIHSQQKKYVLQVASKNSFFNLFQDVFGYKLYRDGFRENWTEYKHDFVKKDFQKLIQEDNSEFVNDSNLFLRKLKNARKELQTKPHIVLLNIDSLSQKFLDDENHLSYIKHLTKDGIYFTDFYFHSGGSINAFTSLLFGLPMIHPYTSFMEDVFKKTKKISLMNILKEEGYKSIHVESCSVDEYKTKENFLSYGGDIVIEKNDFISSNKSKEKHICAANDHLVVQKALSELQKLHQEMPTFTKINLNNLHFFGNTPNIAKYGYPKSFEDKKHCKISKNSVYSEKLQNGLCYINFVVKDFIEKVSDLIGHNLIIVLTGEHRSWEPIPYKVESLQSMQVPLIILDKRGLTPKGVVNKIASHQDVAPTLLYMIGYTRVYPFLGRNLLAKNNEESFTVFQDRAFYSFRKGDYLLEYGRHESQVFKIIEDKDKVKIKVLLDDNDLKLKLEKEFKQYMAGLALWNSVDHIVEKNN